MMPINPKEPASLALIIDDDPTMRLTMGAALMKSGLDMVEAQDGNQGLNLFETREPDIILLDVMLPDTDGFQVCQKIRASEKGAFTQILMVTGLDDIDSIRKAFDAGANGFVSKPINLGTLGPQVLYMLRAGQAFKELHISRNRLAKTQELARIGTWQVDLASGNFHCSVEAAHLLGLNGGDPNLPVRADLSDNVPFDEFFSSIPETDKLRVSNSIKGMIQAKKPGTLEYRISSGDGTVRHILNKSEIITDQQNHAALLLGIVQDVSDLKKAQAEIHYLAFYDSLTGLANRSLFMERMEKAINKAGLQREYLALIFMDLDHFKRINDTLGHHIGDLLLQKVAKNIKKCIRKSDPAARMLSLPETDVMVARFGGDEFSILITGIKEPEAAAMVAQRLLRSIPATYSLEGHEVSVTTSIGISVFPEDGDKAEVLLKNADTALYHAKTLGRNAYQFFTKSMNQAAIERFSIDQDLKKAIDNQELILYYQPKIRLSDQSIAGAEALIRWRHPRRGMIPPDKFIPVAEESGIIVDINRWVLKEACRQAKEWEILCKARSADPPVICINLSGYKLNRQNIVQTLEDTVAATTVDASTIEIEITENILLRETKETITTLNRIKSLNFRIAMDDFGTGYSSLSYLTSFPVDTLKIDRSFVMNSMEDQGNLVIVKAIIAMGRSLGKTIVAEGIESQDQYLFLKGAGCDQGQGYYFYRPMPAHDFETLLVSSKN